MDQFDGKTARFHDPLTSVANYFIAKSYIAYISSPDSVLTFSKPGILHFKPTPVAIYFIYKNNRRDSAFLF